MKHDDEMESFFQSRRADRVADYLQRGRKHSSLDIEQLKVDWIAASERLAADPINHELNAIYDDLDSEFEVRKIMQPYRETIEADNLLLRNLAKITADVKKNDPDKHLEGKQRMVDDLIAFDEKSKMRPN